ncbi:hypothetical protein PHLGIDRAFT_116852 [Phlebiopsis gigantea 11061_1 CR5-6]|uniref:F-box domain-containing protein n=1 Tax=Phlebiopsis gigantea (strain 11061_1 CR5-6) TaxID=745531 RepID=A0A0C3SA37_PHLG1|nr:hypothetical protein PHLGIDRAFT_116852 [Phlebiopsis gigantea 11061_1 CR5-6]
MALPTEINPATDTQEDVNPQPQIHDPQGAQRLENNVPGPEASEPKIVEHRDEAQSIRPNPAQKRKSTAAQSGKRSRPRLSLRTFVDAPVDVLIEVFSHLHPTDLLNLAQTSKTFRAFLLGPASRVVWVRVLAGVPGLPPLPDARTLPAGLHVCAPAYSALLFRSRCTSCGKPNQRSIAAVTFMRCCSECRAKSETLATVGKDWAQGWPDEVRRELPALSALLPCFFFRRKARVPHSVWDAFVDRRAAMDATLLGKPKAEAVNIVRAFVKEYEDSMVAMLDFASRILLWEQNRANNVAIERSKAYDRRHEQVLERLSENGLKQEFDGLPTYLKEDIRTVVVRGGPFPLTDRAWSIIHAEILQRMELCRKTSAMALKGAEVAIKQFIVWYKRRGIHHLPLTPFMPSITDICMHPEIRHILMLQAKRVLSPPSATISPELFEQNVQARLCNAVTDLRARITLSLTGVLRRGLDAQMHIGLIDHPKLLLACAWFSVPTQDGDILTPLRWHEVWRQVCYESTSPRYVPPTPIGPFDAIKWMLWSLCRNHVPSMQRISLDVRFDTLAYKKVVAIMHLIGRDVYTTSEVDMDRSDDRFACLVCGHAMGWRRLVYHSCVWLDPSAAVPDPQIELLDPISTMHLRALDVPHLDPYATLDEPPTGVLCRACRPHDYRYWSPVHRAYLRAHLQAQHGIVCDEVKEGEHYYPSWTIDPSEVLKAREPRSVLVYESAAATALPPAVPSGELA